MEDQIEKEKQKLKEIYDELAGLEAKLHRQELYLLGKHKSRPADKYQAQERKIQKMLEAKKVQNKEEEKYSILEVFEYLEKLRGRDSRNMIGSAPYIQQEFNVSKKTATWLLNEWMSKKVQIK